MQSLFVLMNTKAMNPFHHLPPKETRNKIFLSWGLNKNYIHLFLLLALLLLLQDLLDNLLLLDEESADDAVTDAVTASRTTVGALDGLLGLGDVGVLAGAESGDLRGKRSVGLSGKLCRLVRHSGDCVEENGGQVEWLPRSVAKFQQQFGMPPIVPSSKLRGGPCRFVVSLLHAESS